MKILHVSPSYYPAFRFGGPIVSVHLLNKAIAAKGNSVDVLTTNAGIDEQNKVKLNEWIEFDGIRVMYKSFTGYEHYNFSIPLTREVFKLVKRYDLVHITAVWNYPVLAASLAAMFFKKPFIISPRGELIPEARTIKSKNVKHFYYKLIAQHYLKRASSIHFTSESERKDVMESLHLNVKSFVVPNGIDLSEFQILPKQGAFKSKHEQLSGKKYILFLGRLDKEKGLDNLIKAFSEIIQSGQDLILVLAGPDSNNYKSELESLSAKLNLEERVYFTGFLNKDEKTAALVDAEILVLASYLENFGQVVLEAMACYVPVIVSDKVGLASDIKKFDAGLVTETKPEKIAQSITLMLQNISLKAEKLDNAKKMVNEFSIVLQADRMLNGYRELVSVI